MTDVLTPAQRSYCMSRIQGKDTRPEMIVRRSLHALGYRFRVHVRSLCGIPDLVFPGRRKVIFVHGCFWHMHACARCRVPSTRRDYWIAKMQRNAARDKRTQRELRRGGWRVMVLWECQISPARQERLRAKIVTFLRRKTGHP